MCKYTKYTKAPIMKFIKLLPASFLAIPFILQLNAQIDCCGLAVGKAIKSPTVQKFVPRNQNFGSRTPALVSPFSKPSLCRTAKASGFSPQVNRQNFSSRTQVFKPESFSSSFVSNARKRYCGGRVSRPGVSIPSSSVQSFLLPRGLLYGKADQKHTRFLRSRHSEVGERIVRKHGFERKEQGQGRRTFGQNKKSLR